MKDLYHGDGHRPSIDHGVADFIGVPVVLPHIVVPLGYDKVIAAVRAVPPVRRPGARAVGVREEHGLFDRADEEGCCDQEV